MDELHPDVVTRLARLDPYQRAAAIAPPGPILCVAPAGSGKTTTLVARIAWLVATGVAPGEVAAITFNRRAADELERRLDEALGPLGWSAASVRVRTFHGLGLEILGDSARRPGPLIERAVILGAIAPRAGPAEIAALDTAISRLKVDLGVTAGAVGADPGRGPLARAFVAYQEHLAAAGGLDFDDLILGAIEALQAEPALLVRWRARCAHLLVDEVQDLDRAQLELALLLAAPADRVFLVGDDDQSIYGWRLADVRRILDLDARLADLTRIHLLVNYRCPRPVVERSTRLIANNRRRFPKSIWAGPDARGRLVLAPDGADDHERIGRAIDSWPDDASSRAILARTNIELVPAAAVAVGRGIPFRAGEVRLPLDEPALEGSLDLLLAAAQSEPGAALLVVLARLRAETAVGTDIFGLLLGWAPRFNRPDELVAAVKAHRDRSARLRRDDAGLTLATAHATKGLEFDHVIVLQDADRFPSRRAVDEAADPALALEEERRLAYVAWTRARRSLTLLYDPAAPSQFLLEAFTTAELVP